MRFSRTKISFRVLYELEHTIACLFLVFSVLLQNYRVSSAGESSEGKRSLFWGGGEERNLKDKICHVLRSVRDPYQS